MIVQMLQNLTLRNQFNLKIYSKNTDAILNEGIKTQILKNSQLSSYYKIN